MEANSPRRWFQFSLRTFLTKRRRFRYSLRTALIVVTLLGLGLGFVSLRTQDQRAAVERINELGGNVRYDYKSSLAKWPWLRRLVDDEYLLDVVAVNLSRTKASDADLRVIGKLRRITTLSLYSTDVSDEGLAFISGLSDLSYLELTKTKVTTEGIRRLSLPNGSKVLLGDTSVGDEALSNLSGSRDLGLDGTPITSQGLQQLTGFKNLKLLSIQRTAFDDEAVPILAQFTSLQWLNVTDTKISGEGLFALRNALPNCRIVGAWTDLSVLGTLNPRMIERSRSMGKTTIPIHRDQKHPDKLVVFSGPLIADFHLSLLEDFDSLEVLDLRGASVTDEGVQKLQKASPILKIYR